MEKPFKTIVYGHGESWTHAGPTYDRALDFVDLLMENGEAVTHYEIYEQGNIFATSQGHWPEHLIESR